MRGLCGWAAGRDDRHLHFWVPGDRSPRRPQWARCGLATVLRSLGGRARGGGALCARRVLAFRCGASGRKKKRHRPSRGRGSALAVLGMFGHLSLVGVTPGSIDIDGWATTKAP